MENKTKTNENQMLYYGDIILIKAPLNPTLHNKYFFVEYIGLDKINIIEKTSFEKQSIGLDEQEGTLTDETIEAIKVVFRNPLRGYARQNKLNIDKYVEILFNTKIPKIITGRIINLIEDMIEVKVLDSNKSIFIDFAYRGLPPEYKIKYIKIRDERDFENESPKLRRQTDLQEEKGEELEDNGEDLNGNEDLSENQNNYEELNNEEVEFDENIINEVTINVQLDESEYIYDIKEQKDHLLNDLLSTVSMTGRNQRVMNKINRIVDRFEQTLKLYSIYDSSDNLIQKPFYDKELPFFLNRDKKDDFNHSLHFIMPCIKDIKKKIYFDPSDFDNEAEEQENEEIDEGILDMLKTEYPNISPNINILDLKKFNDSLKEVQTQEVENHYKLYDDILNEFFLPYEVEKNEVKDGDLMMKPIYSVTKNNISFLYLNNDNIPSSISSFKNKPYQVTNMMDTYTSYDKDMYFNSYLFMPNYFIYQSNINNSSKNILFKTLLNDKYKTYDSTLRDDVISNIEIDESYSKSSDLYQKNKYSFEKPVIYLNGKENADDYFDILSPDADDLLSLFNKNDLTSYKQVFDLFDQYKVMQHNLNYDHLNSIKVKLSDSIDNTKRKYIINQKYFSKKIKPKFEHNLKFLESHESDLFVELGRAYFLPNYRDIYNISLQETIHQYNLLDNLDFFTIEMVDQKRNLYNPISNEEIAKLVSQIKEGTYNFDNINCSSNDIKPKNIVKIYNNIEELIQDNYKNVYVDTEINNEFKADIEYYYSIKDRNTSNKIRSLLYNYVVKSKDIEENEATTYVNYLIQEQKPVSVNDYAVLNTGDKKIFYIWTGDHWEPKEEDNTDCIEKSKCISDGSQESDCKKIDGLRQKREKDIIESFVEKIQNDELVNREVLLRNIDLEKKNKLKSLDFKINISVENELIFHKMYLNMIDKVEARKIIRSPNEKLKQKIMSIQDLGERYNLLIQFVKQYTMPGPDQYYLYCIETNVKILPKIVYQLAQAYFSDDKDYNIFINELCKNQGELSDEGDAWVDKYSGYVIKRIDFEEEQMVDGYGNFIKNRSELGDVGIQDIPSNDYDGEEKKKEDEKNLGYSAVKSICLTLMNFGGMKLTKQDTEEMIDNLYERVKKQADAYVVFDDETTDKEKLKQKMNNDIILLFYCISYIFIYFQTSIPDIRPRKTFAGCKRSFKGFPLEDDDDFTGIRYMACILTNIKSKSAPWSGLSRINESKLHDKLIKFMKRDILTNSKIDLRLIKKRTYNYEKTINENLNNQLNDINYSFVSNFRPIDFIKYNPEQLTSGYESLSKEFFKDFKEILRTDLYKEKEKKENLLHGHNEKIGLIFQRVLNEKLQKVELLLNGENGEPFQQNACCNNIMNNPVIYFDESNDLINLIKVSKYYIKNKNSLFKYKKPTNISYDLTIRQIDEEVDYSNFFSEETIFNAFIKYMNFDYPDLPIPIQLSETFDIEKPNYSTYKSEEYKFKALSDEDDSYIQDKINELKKQNYNFSIENLKKLLQIVHTKNIIEDKTKELNIENFKISEQLVTIAQSCDLDNFIFPYIKYKNSNKPFQFKQASSKAHEEFMNQLDIITNEKIKIIENTFMKITSLQKDKKVRYLNQLSSTLLDTPLLKEKINMSSTLLDFMKNDIYDNILSNIDYYIKLITIILPNQLYNFNSPKEMKVPKHWNLSSKHVSDIIGFSKKYNSLIKKIIENSKIKQFMIDNRNQLNEMYNVYNNGFYGYYTSNADNVKKINPIVMYQISLYFYYTALTIYLKPFEKEKNNVNMLKLLITILEIQKEHTKVQHIDYEEIINKVNKYTEGEKEKKKTRLSELSDEERKTEKELKARKLGVWARGLKAGVIKYDKEIHDDERNEIQEIEEEMETGAFFESTKEINEDIFSFSEDVDENYEGNPVAAADEEREYADMSRIRGDGDYEGEYDDEDDFDTDLNAGGYMQDN